MHEIRTGHDFHVAWSSSRDQVGRLLRYLTRDADLTEDLLQETYIRALKGYGGYLGGDFGAWVRRIAANVFYTHARRRSYSHELPLDPQTCGDPSSDPGLGINLEALDVRTAMSGLPPASREYLFLRHYHGLSSEEIGRRVGCPAGTVRWRLSAAISQLRQTVGYPSPTAACCGRTPLIGLFDYVYGTLPSSVLADTQSHLQECPACRETVQQVETVTLKLGELEGSHKVTELLNVDADGSTTLYLSAKIRNTSEQPMIHATFRGNRQSNLTQVVARGKRVDCEYLRDERFRWSSTDFVRGLYAAPLPDPVPPGECLELLTVFRPHPERCARRLDDGRFRLRWTQFPTLFWAADGPYPTVSYSQAIRLPVGARALRFHPLPTEVNCDAGTTLIWHSTMPQFGAFECFVDYRPGEYS